MPREQLARWLLEAEREYRAAQAAVGRDEPGARERMAKAKTDLDEASKAAERVLSWPGHAEEEPVKRELPKTLMELHADLVAAARRELDAAKAALDLDTSRAAEERYALALGQLDRIQGLFPFVAAGAGDVQA